MDLNRECFGFVDEYDVLIHESIRPSKREVESWGIKYYGYRLWDQIIISKGKIVKLKLEVKE